MIVTGTVVAQNPHSVISVLATLKVTEVLKGDPLDDESENIFFVKGSQQGAFPNADGKVVQTDPRLPAAALKQPVSEPSGMSEFEAFVELVRAKSSSTSSIQ